MVFHDPIKGLHYGFDGLNITFFAARGRVVDADTWAINKTGGVRFNNTKPKYVSRSIGNLISLHAAAGHADIASVVLTQHTAVLLWLEGVLTNTHLENLKEGIFHIDLLNVEIAGRIVTVRVLAELEDSFENDDGFVIADGHFRPL